MKKFLGFVLALATLFSVGTVATACAPSDAIIVQTNAFFAPFEYYEGTDIVGVDVDIMEKVGEKLGKDVIFQDGDFAIIIDVVSQGTMADAGAAGITITDERKEKVDFSIPYYTSVQYVIWEEGNADFATSEAADGTDVILWEQLRGKKIGNALVAHEKDSVEVFGNRPVDRFAHSLSVFTGDPENGFNAAEIVRGKAVGKALRPA